jgi:excisionase family DNA binding protein
MQPLCDVLTTGQVAKICNVAPRTVSKWFDSGQLRGYRIPGSKDRRIPLDHLIRFMKAHGIPLNGLDGNRPRVLVVDADETLVLAVTRLLENRGQRVERAGSVMAAGLAAERLRPHVIIVDVDLPCLDAGEFIRALRAHDDLQAARLIGLGRKLDSVRGQALRQGGFDSWLAKPFEPAALARLVDDALSVIS